MLTPFFVENGNKSNSVPTIIMIKNPKSNSLAVVRDLNILFFLERVKMDSLKLMRSLIKFSADFFSPQILYIKLRFFAMILTLMEGKRGEIGQILSIYNYLQRKIPKNGCFLQTILILYNY